MDPDAAALLVQIAGAPRLEDGSPEQARAAHVASAMTAARPALREIGAFLRSHLSH
ncbi:hypothetical protein BH24ACT10_BH24ACT10_02590 [soil metagenome]